MDNQKITFKRQRPIALITILVMIFNLFMPYSIVFADGDTSTKTLVAEVDQSSDAQFLFDDFQVICITLKMQGDYTYTGVDLSFQYDPDILTPYYQSMTKVGRNWVENYFEADNMTEWAIGDADLSSSFTENNTYLFKDEARFTLEGTIGTPRNPETDGEPYTVATMYFKVADGYTPSTIPATAFGLKPIARLSKGMEMAYRLPSGGQTVLTEGFGYEGFEDSAKEVDSIAVKTLPTKTSYEWGENIDLTGGELTVSYTDGSSEDISMTATGVGIMSGDPANLTINPPEVTVSYGGKTAPFNITVTDPVTSLAVTTPMSKIEYSHDDPLDFTGLVLTATKKSGATQTLSATSTGVSASDSVASINSAGFTQTSPAGQVPVSGNQKITFTYEGKTATQTVIVNDEITSIDLVSQPTKTVYKIKENLDLTGAKVRVNLKSGNHPEINLPDGSITVSTYSKNLTGTVQHLSVAMGDKTASDTIDVEAYNYIRDIIVTSPSDRTPMYNTNLNLSGSAITEQWADNTMSNKGQIQASMISGYDKTKTGAQTITVTYPVTYTLSDGTTIPQTFTKTFTVNVINPPDTITITAPTKTVYNHGDTLALSTGTILVTYIDGSTKNVPMIASMVKEGSNAVDMSPTNYDSTNKVNKVLTIKYMEDGVSGTAAYPITIVNDVQSISVTQMPKQTYNVNETLDLDNGEITVTRAYGSPEVISMQDSRVSVTGLNTSSETTNQPLTVKFTENDITKSTSYSINVVDSVTGITVNNPPTVAKYGQPLDLSSTTIDVTKGSGTTPGVPATTTGVTITGYDPNTLGPQTVTLEYLGKTKTFDVEVKDYVTKITLNPNSVSGIKGTALATIINDNNIEYTVHYAKAGAGTPVALPASMITSSYSSTAASQNVTAEYTDMDSDSATEGEKFYATLTIALSNDVTAVDLTAPTKDTYKHGEAIDVSTTVIDLTFEDTTHGNGNTADLVVTELDGVTPVSMTPALSDYTDNKYSKTVLIKYTDTATSISNTVNYTFDIINDVQSIAMHTTPKDEYNIGDSIDLTNGEILVTRALGTPEVISMSDSRVTVTGFDSSVVNAALPISVKFTENGIDKSTSYNVKVEDNVTAIAMKTTPKQNYKYNEALDVTGGEITATKGSGSVDVPMTAAMVTELDGSAFDPTTLGTRNVLVTYEGKTTNYEITIKDYVTGIAVSPNPASGTLGDTLADVISNNSIKYTVTYAKAGAGSPTALAESMVTTAYSDSATTQSLTVEYEDNDADSATNGDKFTDTLTVNLSNEITGVSISSLPTKATYNHGDTIDLTGAVVTLTYADTTTGNGNISDIVVTETDGSALNMSPAAADYTNNKLTKTVNLTYTLASDASITDTVTYTFDIINDVQSIAMQTTPKTTYNVNDTLDVTGGEILVTRATGTPEVISMSDANVTVDGFVSNVENTSLPLTVKYTENGVTKQTTYNVSVQDSVTGMVIKTLPKQNYKYNEPLDVSAGEITVTKGSGSSDIPMNASMITEADGLAFDPQTLGTRNLTVTYGGKTATYEVTVKDYVTGIAVSPNPASGTLGDSLADVISNNSIKYTVTYAKAGAGSPTALAESMVTTAYSSAATTQSLTVEYEDNDADSATNGDKFTDTLTVNLSNEITGVSISSLPTKATYNHGDTIDLTGAVVTLTYADTTTGNGNISDIVVTETDGSALNMSPAATDYTNNKLTKTVNLTYTLASDASITDTVTYTFDIINDVQSIAMQTTPKTSYNVNDTLDVTGGEILVTRATGTPEVISMSDANVTVDGFVSNVENTSLPLVVKYTENGVTKQTSYNVSVQDSVTAMVIKTLPKQNYKYDEPLDVSAGEITVTKGSGSSDIPMTASMITEADGSAFDPQTLGTRNLTVTYGGKTATYEVTVKDYVTGITVSPNSVNGTLGDTLADIISDNSITYTVTYAKAGADTPIALAESMVTTAYSSAATTQSLTVEYEDDDANSATNGDKFTDTLTVNLSNEVTGVSISSLPTKATYNHGEAIDLTGAVVTLTYADTTTGTGNVSDIVVTETDGSALNMSPAATDYTNNKLTKTVNLTYTDASNASITDTVTYTFDIINDVQSIAIQTTPKTSYNVNDTLDVTGGEILVTRATGTPEVISMSDANVTVDGFDSTIENTNLPLTVKYTENGIEKQVTYNVSVQDSVTAVAIVTTPKQNYRYDEPLDVTGGEIEITKGSGTQTIPMNASMITEADGLAFDPQTLGTRNLTVTYGGKTATYEVTVKDYVTGIKVNPDTVTGDYNDELSDVIADNSIEYVVTYAKAGDQSPIALTDAMITTTYNKQDTNEQTLTVKYTDNDPDSASNGDDFTADLKVTLIDAVSAAVIDTTPKTDYKYGDSLDVTAGKIKVTQTSGEHIIPMTSDMVTEEDGTPFDSTKLGTRNLKVTYGDIVMTYEITVSDFVTGIILTPPTKDVYDYNEPLDLTGGSVQTIMASGATTPVVPLTDGDVQVSGYDPTTVGAQTITVEYEGETKTFGVFVNDGVTSITINPVPAKTSYLYGEALDVTGGKIVVTYASASPETINITPSMVSGFDPTVLGNQTLTVTYQGVTDTYNVNVEDYVDDIEIVAPYKLTYAIGESLDLTGATVNSVMASGIATTPVAITPAMVSGFNSSSEGVKTITVTYAGKTKTFAVTVSDEMAGWTVKSVPNKLTYLYGESLDLTGSELEITKESGATETVSVTSSMVSGYTPYTLGTQTLTVTYEGETKQFTQVTVEDYIKKLNVKTPTKTTYHYGEDINLDGGSVSIIMASGATAETAEMTGAMISGYNSTNPGTQTINVEYKGLTGSFTVKVVDEVKGISINTTPNKTVYEQGEGLDVTGGTIRVVRDSGIYTIPMSQTAVTGYNPNTPGSQTVTVTYEGQSTTFVVIVNKKQEEEKPQTEPESTTPRRSSSGGTRVVYVNTATNTNTNNNPEPKAEVPTETPKTEQPKEEVKKEQPKQKQEQKKKSNDKPVKTLGVKDEKKPDDGNRKKLILAGIIGIAILLLLLLALLKRNVKVYVQEDAKKEKFVLGGLDKIKKNNPELDIDKFLDEDTYPNKVKVVLDDSISEKLDGKEIEIKHRGQKIKIKVKYEDKPFEFILY